MTKTINPRLTIDGQEIDAIITNMFFQDAKEYIKKSAEYFNPAVCQISGIMTTTEEWEELREELKRLEEQNRLKYYAGMKDYIDMLAMAQVGFRYDVISSEIWNSVHPRGFTKGLENMTLWELYCILMDEVEWIKETRY